MKMAIYARYSTDKQDKSSITGQLKNCRARAKELGFRVTAEFKDEARSGTDLSRPGLLALQESLNRGDVDGVIVDETSRLARTTWTLSKMIEDLAFRDQFIVDCKGFDSRNEAGELMASINAAMDSMERKKIKARTHRGLRERFDKGFSAGGISYGYAKPTNGDPAGWRQKKVNPAEAKIVVEIFQMYADGMSPRAIAAELNERGVPSPGATWNRKGGKAGDGKWRASAINGDLKRGTGILCNPLYRGDYVWNRTEWRTVPGTKKRKCITRPKSEWRRMHDEALRIVDDALWSRVQTRRQEVTNKSRKLREALRNNAGPGRGPRYLLSGILKCDECGRNYIMADGRRYKCSSHTNGGKHACKNDIPVPRELAEAKILAGVRDDLLAPSVVKEVRKEIAQVVKQKKAERTAAEPRKGLKTELANAERKLANLAEAIADRGYSEQIKAELDKWEQRRDEIRAELATKPTRLDTLPDVIPKALKRYRDKVLNLAQMRDSRSTSRVQMARARSAL